MRRLIVVPMLALLAALLACSFSPTTLLEAPREEGVVEGAEIPPATIQNDEGGVRIVSGEVTYTNPFFTEGVAQPLIILEDQAGFINRNRDYVIPVQSQVMGQITSDFLESPFTYTLTLPVQPQGDQRDVDHDGVEEAGVMVFAVAYWNNIWGDPFLQERDLGGGGWSTAYASTRVSDDAATDREIIGGKVIVYASDDQQGFPAGFGEDGLLFTDDDPIVGLPQGYTLVDLDADPFIFDRSQEPTADLIEPEGAALSDFSSEPYAQAFDELVEKMSQEYAFTDYKNIDWEALHEEYRPQFAEAQRRFSTVTYRELLWEFLMEIPDGHVSGSFPREAFSNAVGGGLGFAIREVDNGDVYVTFLTPGGPAEQAGIEVGAQIISLGGTPITQVIDDTVPWLGPHSTPHNRRIDQQRFATRISPGTSASVTYQNPGEDEDTATLDAIEETESLAAVWPGIDRTGFELPVEYRQLDNGIAYVKIYSFFDNDVLTIQIWERLLQTLNENEVTGLIIDLRDNGGGRGFLADQMAAYFFTEELVLGNSGYYDESLGEFHMDPETQRTFILPPSRLRYEGPVAVIVSPACASACEFFTFDMTLQNRAQIVGHFPTAGLGGSIEEVKMPEDVDVRFTIGRAVDPEGNIHIEGKGIAPTVDVPFTREVLFTETDVLLQAAIETLETTR